MPQVPYLLDAGWELSLVSSPAPKTYHSSLNSKTIEMSRAINPLKDVKSVLAWRDLLRSLNPDVVLASTPKAGLLATLGAKSVGVPKRVYLHRGAVWEGLDGWRRQLMMQLDRLTMSAATHNLAVSNSLADLVLSSGLTRNRPHVLGSGGSKGVDLTAFQPGELPDPGSPPTLGFLGRIAADKGIDMAVEAFWDLRRIHPDATFLIGGKPDARDPVPEHVLERINDADGIELLGGVADVPAFMQKIDLLVFPSVREGLPNVVIEAAACGVPTVGWNVTGVRDAVRQGLTGELVRVGNRQALAAAVARWAMPTAEVQQACRTWAESFDQELLALALVDYLDTVYAE